MFGAFANFLMEFISPPRRDKRDKPLWLIKYERQLDIAREQREREHRDEVLRYKRLVEDLKKQYSRQRDLMR
jgi:hypothetical protein